jgi:hypothetical protein
MLNWIAIAAGLVCAVLLLFWGFALLLWRPLPALFEITRTSTFRLALAVALLIMLLAIGLMWKLRRYGVMPGS